MIVTIINAQTAIIRIVSQLLRGASSPITNSDQCSYKATTGLLAYLHTDGTFAIFIFLIMKDWLERQSKTKADYFMHMILANGGSEGQVRLQKLGRDSQQLVATLKKRNMPVTALRVIQDDLEFFFTRHSCLKQMINTANFQGINYLPDNSQFIACRSDRFATYFDAFEGKKLREVELSDKELFNIAVDPTWMMLALVGADKLVKLVDYDDGKKTFIGH
ncbi:MAG: hypothetical protein EZS28_005306 [Streblomastix strix]|uniref:Uncharacterized protein n=1 Tax=Streblomastix strix TaxID=222440 RepID=A0A5J4WVY1_9EUKA|nr:MAG: hypothetical protein EZS28_005306 [Streblomastix strix]